MNLLLCGGLVFLAIGIMIAAFGKMLETVMEQLHYVLYRYMVAEQYVAAPVNYDLLMIPAVLAGVLGVALCLGYFVKSRGEKG